MMTSSYDNGAGRDRQPPPRRSLPHNLECEASVLGGVICNSAALGELGELKIEDFYHSPHRVVFEAMRNLEAAGTPIDVVTIEAEIDRRDRLFETRKLEAIGGIGFIGELALRVPIIENIHSYAAEVRQHARLRRAILELSAATERLYTWPHDPAEAISETIGQLARIDESQKKPADRIRLIDVDMALKEIEDLATAPVYPTPFPTVNDAIGFGGFIGTQVYTLAAGTGRGKTSFVAHVGSHVAADDHGAPVLLASYEMKPGYFVARRAAGVLGVHSNDILRGNVSHKLVHAAMPHQRLFMLHKPSLGDLRLAVEQLAQKFGKPPLVIVDYLQKLTIEVAKKQQRVDMRLATSEASDTLLDIADKTRAAILSVSSVSRQNNRKTANPRKLEPYELVDVAKESGDVEYDGAGLIVLSLSREIEFDERVATITLAKTRFGRECHIDARYHGARGDWRDCGEVDVEPDENLEEVADKIIADLHERGPAKNATAIYDRVKGTKSVVMNAVRDLIKADRIVKTSKGLLPSGARSTQTEMRVE